MVYPNPFKLVARRLADNTVVAASGFKRFGKVNFGARMALFQYDNAVVVWSAMPHGEDITSAMELLTGQKDKFNVAYLIIPDKEHTMAAASFKKAFPAMKIIAMESVDLGSETPVEYIITSKYAHKVIGKEILAEIGLTDPVIANNFEFVYLPNHGNKELVTYDKNTKTVYEADLLFNLRSDEQMEQFSTQLGFPANYNIGLGLSFLAPYMNPDSKVGNFLINKITNSTASADGLRAIYSWDFDRLVMCHGNIFETGGKAAFKKVFGKVLA